MTSKNWNSSPHPISDVRDWDDLKRLEIKPSYQRGAVWSRAAKIMLIDSIVSEIPMPKILVSKKIIGGSTHRTIIDGQQRTRAILEFLGNEFPLTSPYEGKLKGKFFRDFTEVEVNKFLSYQIDFNESTGLNDDEIREVYSRLNKYTTALNKQELRRADFPGDFLDLSEELANDKTLDEFNIFSPSSRRRLGDVEYISELLSVLIDGVQDKKKNLDSFYINHMKWDKLEKQKIVKRFNNIISFIQKIFNSMHISDTRFRQKSDFYSLFIAVDKFIGREKSLTDEDIVDIEEVLHILDNGISPSSEVEFFKQYAVRCLSDANSSSSRTWRVKFIYSLLFQPFITNELTEDQERMYISILSDLPYLDDSGMCPIVYPSCILCEKTDDKEDNRLLVCWHGNSMKNIANAMWVHKNCLDGNCQVIDNMGIYPPYKDKVQSKLYNLSDFDV